MGWNDDGMGERGGRVCVCDLETLGGREVGDKYFGGLHQSFSLLGIKAQRKC